MLVGDEPRLQQIAINLVGNAIKFTDQGSVTISAYLPDENTWAIAVKDTGPGIPEDAQSYIFDAFRQIDGSVTRKHEGFGLGLSIVQQLTTLMKGHVTVESTAGQGSVFTVILPLVIPAKETEKI
jgi:signal transduction histidine kinase